MEKILWEHLLECPDLAASIVVVLYFGLLVAYPQNYLKATVSNAPHCLSGAQTFPKRKTQNLKGLCCHFTAPEKIH